MNLQRRDILRLAASAAALLATPAIARAEKYPTKPVRIIVGYAAGGAADTLARWVAQSLSERLGQSLIIENRVGAGGNIATDMVMRSPADGYTLLVNTMPNIVSAPLSDDFEFARDMTPIGGISRGHLVMLVHPSVAAKTLPEFIAHVKENPGKVTMASAGNGTPPHMAGELFKLMAGVDLVHVPYRGGGPALADLLGGQVQVMFSNLPSGSYISSGKLRALAVTSAARSKTLPDVPAIGEFVRDYEASVSFGLCAPKALPAEIVEQLNRELNACLSEPATKAKLADLEAQPLAVSAESFKTFLSTETAKWNKVATSAHIRLK